jgi:hypothetical protein
MTVNTAAEKVKAVFIILSIRLIVAKITNEPCNSKQKGRFLGLSVI